MTPQRFHWLLPRIRHFYRHNPWLVDRWLEELAAECDERQWEIICRILRSFVKND